MGFSGRQAPAGDDSLGNSVLLPKPVQAAGQPSTRVPCELQGQTCHFRPLLSAVGNLLSLLHEQNLKSLATELRTLTD